MVSCCGGAVLAVCVGFLVVFWWWFCFSLKKSGEQKTEKKGRRKERSRDQRTFFLNSDDMPVHYTTSAQGADQEVRLPVQEGGLRLWPLADLQEDGRAVPSFEVKAGWLHSVVSV